VQQSVDKVVVDEIATREHAIAGAQMLDDEVSEWYMEVNLDNLVMADATRCIGAFIGWDRMKSILRRREISGVDVGLVRASYYRMGITDGGWDAYTEEYGILQDQWICEINRRRETDRVTSA
jgi:hypothetical protein